MTHFSIQEIIIVAHPACIYLNPGIPDFQVSMDHFLMKTSSISNKVGVKPNVSRNIVQGLSE